MREFQCVTFEHANSAAPQTYSADISPRNVTAVLFTTQLCFFPPWKEVIPFLSVQLKYANSPGCSDKVKVGTFATNNACLPAMLPKTQEVSAKQQACQEAQQCACRFVCIQRRCKGDRLSSLVCGKCRGSRRLHRHEVLHRQALDS